MNKNRRGCPPRYKESRLLKWPDFLFLALVVYLAVVAYRLYTISDGEYVDRINVFDWPVRLLVNK